MAKEPNAAGDKPAEQDPLLSILAARVRELRRAKKLTQSELGAAIGSNQGYMFGVEAGDANITLKTLARLADALGVEPGDLLSDKRGRRSLGKAEIKQIDNVLHAAMQEVRANIEGLNRDMEGLKRNVEGLNRLAELLQSIKEIITH